MSEHYSVWRVLPNGEAQMWDGPLSAEDAEKVRFCRQRDQEITDGDAHFEVRPGYYPEEQSK